MLSYGFEEGTLIIRRFRFSYIHENGTGGILTKKDYALTIDTAKEISMLQEQKGKQAKNFY
jgi:phage anti-repressor protein